MAVSKYNLSTNNYILVCSLFGVVLAIVTLFLVRSLVPTLLHNQRVISKKQTALKQAVDNQATISQLGQEYDQLGTNQLTIEHALPTTEDFTDLVSVVDTMATNAGLRVKTVNQLAATSGPANNNVSS